jgi:hypothetical protein
MSKHKSRKGQQSGLAIKKKYLPLIIGIVALMVIGGAFILVGRGAEAVEPKVTGAPAIEVEQTYFDLGDMRFNQIARVTYEVTNVGDQPLEILEYPNVQVVEGC